MRICFRQFRSSRGFVLFFVLLLFSCADDQSKLNPPETPSQTQEDSSQKSSRFEVYLPDDSADKPGSPQKKLAPVKIEGQIESLTIDFQEKGIPVFSLSLTLKNPEKTRQSDFDKINVTAEIGGKTASASFSRKVRLKPGEKQLIELKDGPAFRKNPKIKSGQKLVIDVRLFGKNTEVKFDKTYEMKPPLINSKNTTDEKNDFLFVRQQIQITNPNRFGIKLKSMNVSGTVKNLDFKDKNALKERFIKPNEKIQVIYSHKTNLFELYGNAYEALARPAVKISLKNDFLFPFFHLEQKFETNYKPSSVLLPLQNSLN